MFSKISMYCEHFRSLIFNALRQLQSVILKNFPCLFAIGTLEVFDPPNFLLVLVHVDDCCRKDSERWRFFSPCSFHELSLSMLLLAQIILRHPYLVSKDFH